MDGKIQRTCAKASTSPGAPDRRFMGAGGPVRSPVLDTHFAGAIMSTADLLIAPSASFFSTCRIPRFRAICLFDRTARPRSPATPP